MRIKSLHMFGFKSFADRTDLFFEKQIVGVVGPNGCGKSNIVDAIRWVMGEQSAKGLRGNEMSDVIFNGTSTRKKAAFSEVSLVFDNADHTASAPYTDCAEVMITRRLYRSGESEYLINKVAVRLKDINDLFLGTGSSARAYSIVAQGKVDQIVLAKPEDRRFLLEEAAGVAKYKARKQAAERKMESVKTNLERVHDIIKELERNVKYLDRQVARAEEFRKLQTELRRLDEQVIAAKVTQLDRKADVNNQKLLASRIDFETKSTELASLEAEIEGLRFEALNQEKASAGDYEKLLQLKELYSKADKDIELSIQRVGLLENQIREREKDLERIRAKSEANQEAIQQVLADRERLQTEWEAAKIEIDRHRTEIETLETQIKALEFDLGVKEKEIEQKRTQAAREAQKKEMLQAERVEYELKRCEIEASIEQMASEVLNVATAQTTTKSELEQYEARILGLENDLKVMIAQTETLRTQQTDLIQTRATKTEELSKIEVEVKGLQTLEDHEVGYERGAIARRKETGAPLVLDIVKFKAGHEKLAEAFFSEFGQLFIDTNDSYDSGDKTRWSRLSAQSFEPSESSLLNYIENDIPLVLKNFISQIQVVDTINFETATSVIQIDYQGSLNLPLGPSAQVLSRGILRKEDTPFGRKSEFERFAEQKISAQLELQKIEKDLSETKEQITSTGQKIQESQSVLKTSIKTRSELQSRLVKLETQLESMEKAKTQLTTSLQTVDEKLQNLASQIAEFISTIDLAELEQTIFQVKEQLEGFKTQKKMGDANWIEKRIRFGAIEERLDRLKQQSIHVEMTQSEYSHNQSLFQTDVTAWKAEIDIEMARRLDLDHQKDSNSMLIRELEIRVSETRSKLNTVRSQLEQLEVGRKDVLSVKESSQSLVQELELEHQKLKFEVEELAQLVEVRYNASLQDILATVTEEDLQRLEDSTVLGSLEVDAKDLREKLEKFGEVNLLALTEFQEITKRLEFMNVQREDLLRTLDSLQSIIDRINKITEFRFRETFKAINHNFQLLFPKLFGGGRAYMTLTDENNLLETGVEIFAEPPGKKVQTMSLLSGGEKAMTSISLLFALFAYRPASFCILDEVDAPLDEVNTFRYNSIIEEMASLSQFIVITHNKRTMEVAETLFGVTMQDPGSSQIVGVHLQEARAFVSTDAAAVNS